MVTDNRIDQKQEVDLFTKWTPESLNRIIAGDSSWSQYDITFDVQK